MGLGKFDVTSDAIANLYRASFYLAKGARDVAVSFLEKAEKRLGDKMNLDVEEIAKGVSKNDLFWAEKVLDEYKRLKGIC